MIGRSPFAAIAAVLALTVASAPVAKLQDRLSRSGKGALVLQVGSDWCVSGERVRKVFESPAFARAVGSRYELAVYDDMDKLSDEVKAKNSELDGMLIRTKRFPAITCYAPGEKPRVFAQIENVPGNVTADSLAAEVLKAVEKKDRAMALFKQASASSGETAADRYGEGFDLLASMMGPFHFSELTKGKCAWRDEWAELVKLDDGDRFGWCMHFAMDEHKCVKMVESVTSKKDASYVESIKKIPQKHFNANQKQCVKILEYALLTEGTNKPLSPETKKLLKDAFEMGRDTFWGQFAMGRLMMDGESIESRELPKASVRSRPPEGTDSKKWPFPLETVKKSIHEINPNAALNEKQKLAVARYAALRLIGEKGWSELVARPGSSRFVRAFLNDRVWLEDFAWSGTFASGGSGPGDGADAILALESLIYQDNGRWTPFADGRFSNNSGRRFMTALALVFPKKDEAWLADVLDAYRETALAGRLHKSAYGQGVWAWRFALQQGTSHAGTDNFAAQQRHLDKFVNLPCREYGGTCWMVAYRGNNCFGDSVQGPLYYKPWATAGEWPKRRYTQIVGGVCGELSKFGSSTANAHGLPSTTAGQPGHCAYTRRSPDGVWHINNSVTGHTQMHMCFWGRHSWQYTTAIEGTFNVDRESRLASDRLVALATLAEERGLSATEIETCYRQACRACHTHYGTWLAYGAWITRQKVPLTSMRAWARGCARGFKAGRPPLWDILSPYFSALFKEKGKKALADDLVIFAPLLRQGEDKIQEEADFKVALKKWTAPVEDDAALLAQVFKAMLEAQYGTRSYFSQVLDWGGERMLKENETARIYVKMLGDVLTEKGAEGGKAKVNLAPVILGASRSGNIESFRQMTALQDRLEPYNGRGKSYPETDFGGQLVSVDGLLKTSSTSNWDDPRKYARALDTLPCDGGAFHTGKEKSPWATVVLKGAAEVKGIVIVNGGAGQNRHRQLPFEVQVSEDGDSWRTVHHEEQIQETYRIDLGSEAPRARYVRVRREPDAKHEFFHLTKILVYGRKLY